MKKTFIYFCFSLLTFGMLAQTDGITYQAVIIDTNPEQIPGVDIPSNNLPNVSLDVRFSILNGANSIEYQEVQITETDAYGMIHLTIGQGSTTGGSGAFDEIYWIDEKTLRVDIDLRDGSGFVNFSSQSLTYIPYVKHREIIATSTLDVDGITNLNSELNVNNQSPTNLSGDLTVDGITNLNSALNVNNQATTTLSGDLYVEGQAYFGDAEFDNIVVNENSNLNVVAISGATTIDGPTVINGTTRLNGETEVNNSFDVVNGNNSLLSGNLIVQGETNLDSNLNVNNGSTTNLSGDLFVGGQAFFGDAEFENIAVNQNSTLNVLEVSGSATIEGPSILNGTARMNGATEVNNDFSIINGNNSQLTGDVVVDGITNLNSSLSVNNGSPTSLSGTLQVDGASNLSSTLDVGGITNLGNELNVNNNSASNLTGSLTVGGISDLNGQVTIDANVNGGQTSTASYPLRVRGSNQGIYIKVDGATANNSNNFMSFGDDTRIRGRIEGQTANELQNSFEYGYFLFITSFEATFLGLMVIADIAGLDDIDASVFEGVQAAQVIANGVVQTQHWNNVVGVSFESGSADYAEWLEKKSKSETFSYGDIVGVTGGKISKVFQQPDHYMVISKSPLVLGNMPEVNREQDYEKVAFMGQVPVKVFGSVRIGDYIIPSGLQDGVGRGVSPSEITIEEYKKIIGVAWSASSNKGISYVNVAIGINANDTAVLLEKQQQEITKLQAQINDIAIYLAEKDTTFHHITDTANLLSKNDPNSRQYVWSDVQNFSEENNEETLKTNTDLLLQMLESQSDMVDNFMFEVKARLDQQKVNYQQFEQLNRLVTDREYFLSFAKSYYKN